MAKQIVLERLNRLVAKGYVVRWGESEQDTLRLEHPRAPDLTLFADGRIWVLTLSPDDWIAAENESDQRRFKSFVRRIPKPTTLQRFKATTVEDLWTRVTVWAVVTVIALVGALVGAFLLGWVWRLMTGK
jgi:hypothetical protein